MRQPGIYVLENTTTGKQYVGQSVDVNKRKQQHFNAMQKGKHHNQYIQRDYNMGHNFSFGIIEYCDISSLNQREKYWIDRLNTYYNGYNLTGGGGKTFVYVDKTPQKSWREIHQNRSEIELNNYNRRTKRLKKWTRPDVLLIMITAAILGRLLSPIGLIIFYGVIFIYLIQLLTLYSAKKDYNFAVKRLKVHGVERNKLGSVTIHFFKLILENIKEYDFSAETFKNRFLTFKNDITDEIKDTLEINRYRDEIYEKKLQYYEKDSGLKMKKCPSCNHSLNRVAKKCPYCEYVFKK